MAQQADYSDLITKYSQKYGVPEKLIRQLISVESSGNAKATSPTGPAGLMQVSTAVAKEAGYTKADMYDPEKNIDAGTKYLAANLKAFKGHVPSALLGYNQGTGGAKQMLSGKKPMAQEGYNYIHNKKFSPEYLSKDASIPIPQQTQATSDLVQMGRQAVEAPKNPYDSASMMQEVPQEAQPQPEQPKEPSDTDILRMVSDKARQLFNPGAAYSPTPTSSLQQGVLSLSHEDIVKQLPSMRNAAALFGGFN